MKHCSTSHSGVLWGRGWNFSTLRRLFPHIFVVRIPERILTHFYEFPGIFYSKWSKNPYTQGSYPNAVTGTTSNDFHNLQGNLKRLYFAGDGVLKTWVGYAQGAYLSGVKMARAVLACMKRDCPHFYPKKTIVQSIFVNQKSA